LRSEVADHTEKARKKKKRQTHTQNQEAGIGVFAASDEKREQTLLMKVRGFSGIIHDRPRCAKCHKPKPSVACTNSCGEVYCATACRDAAFDTFHAFQ
jgi:hypothetical protein